MDSLHKLFALMPRDDWVAVSFIPIAVFFVWALWNADRGSSSTFKFVHFVTNEVGRGSFYALGYTVLVIVCAWGVWALIVLDRLTEWYMTLIIGGFVLGALGGTVARVMARAKGAAELNAAAGDSDAPAQAAFERTTTTRETTRVPTNPLAPAAVPGAAPVPVEVTNPEPIEVTQTPKTKKRIGAKRK